ncbi:energy transducer TonB [Echinicola sediminis]
MEAKKTPKADLSRKYGLFLNIGLLISLSLVLAAFEFKSYSTIVPKDLEKDTNDFPDILDIPVTVQKLPPPPKIEQPEVEEVPNEEEILDNLDLDFDINLPENASIEDIAFDNTPPIVDKADEIVDFAEKMPEFPGGLKAWGKFLYDNLKYPSQARRMGIQGTVYLVFVVNTDGSIQDVEILRGVDGGCSEEAIRVLKKAPNWKPGLQGGRPVRVKMRLPIKFQLN